MSRYLSFALLSITAWLGGCGIATVPIYEGATRPATEVATISGVSFYPDRNAKISTVSINGKEVDQLRTSEFMVLPGHYSVSVRVLKDYDISMSAGIITSNWKEVLLNIELEAEAGHTYIADVSINGEIARGFFRDMGIGFNKECMPLRRFAIMYGGTANGKRAGCPD